MLAVVGRWSSTGTVDSQEDRGPHDVEDDPSHEPQRERGDAQDAPLGEHLEHPSGKRLSLVEGRLEGLLSRRRLRGHGHVLAIVRLLLGVGGLDEVVNAEAAAEVGEAAGPLDALLDLGGELGQQDHQRGDDVQRRVERQGALEAGPREREEVLHAGLVRVQNRADVEVQQVLKE